MKLRWLLLIALCAPFVSAPVDAQPVFYHGLRNDALGQAQLTVVPKAAPVEHPRILPHNGTLTVSNIGSSGQDGVSIELGARGRPCWAWTSWHPAGPACSPC